MELTDPEERDEWILRPLNSENLTELGRPPYVGDLAMGAKEAAGKLEARGTATVSSTPAIKTGKAVPRVMIALDI